jgi:hypothetical protein
MVRGDGVVDMAAIVRPNADLKSTPSRATMTIGEGPEGCDSALGVAVDAQDPGDPGIESPLPATLSAV